MAVFSFRLSPANLRQDALLAQIARLRIDPGDVDPITYAANHAIIATGHDFRRIDESIRIRDQRPCEERLDVARRNNGDRLRLERADSNRWRDAHGLACCER